MQIKTYILLMFVLAMFANTQTSADTASNREYQLKAAFLYNFIMFVEWPKEKTPDANEPIIIGILGQDPFGNAFDPVKDRKVKGRDVTIRRFGKWEDLKKLSQEELNKQITDIRKCHLLFICNSEKPLLKEIINVAKDHNILTVGDMENFLEPGSGIIRFVIEDDKIRFEINATAAANAKLKIRSQLLRLAKKVIKESPSHVER
jgi:hypothetical protein